MNVLTTRVVGPSDALAYSVRRECQEPVALCRIMRRWTFDAERMAPLVPGHPRQERFSGGLVRVDQCLVLFVDQHQAQLADPHPEGGVVRLDAARGVPVVTGRAKARVDGHSQRFRNNLPPARAYLLQKASIACRQNIPGKLEELS